MKKYMILGVLLLSVFTLSACETEVPETIVGNIPVFGDIEDITAVVGDNLNLFDGVTATDIEDGDLTDSISITNFNELPMTVSLITAAGYYTVEYYVIDSDGNQVSYNRSFTVNEPDDLVIDDDKDIIVTGNCVSDIEGMVVTFCDDFTNPVNPDDTGVDMDKWGYQNGDGTEYGIAGWGNNEQEYYRAENSYVAIGNLYIEAKLEDFGGKAYTSSKLVTDQKFSQTFGRFEARIQLPVGNGLWPAFWMMPEDNVYGGWARSGEIDIMEAKGRLPQHASGAIHYGNNWPNNVYQSGGLDLPVGEGIDTFHVYAVEWTSTSIKWFIDDTMVWEATEWYSEGNEFPAPFDQDFYLILNLAVGGNFDGNRLPQDSIFEEKVVMIVDYVRVLQYEE